MEGAIVKGIKGTPGITGLISPKSSHRPGKVWAPFGLSGLIGILGLKPGSQGVMGLFRPFKGGNAEPGVPETFVGDQFPGPPYSARWALRQTGFEARSLPPFRLTREGTPGVKQTAHLGGRPGFVLLAKRGTHVVDETTAAG